MARLRPEDVALAERIVRRHLLAFLDRIIAGADVEGVFVGEEDSERIREASHHAPLREVAGLFERVVVRPEVRLRLVVPEHDTLRVEMRDERAHLLGLPRAVEVPSGEQDL